jgi:glutathione S-transferase
VTRDLDVPAPIERVWAALVDPATIRSWLTCQDVAFEARVGGRFRLFDGEATGAVTRLAPLRLVEYTWQMGAWPAKAPPSRVRWELRSHAGGRRTRLRLTHTGFPDRATRDAHDAGWDSGFLDKLLPWLAR